MKKKSKGIGACRSVSHMTQPRPLNTSMWAGLPLTRESQRFASWPGVWVGTRFGASPVRSSFFLGVRPGGLTGGSARLGLAEKHT